MVLFSFSFNLRSFLFFVISYDWTNAQRNSKKKTPSLRCVRNRHPDAAAEPYAAVICWRRSRLDVLRLRIHSSKQTAQVFRVDASLQRSSPSLTRSCTDDVTASFYFLYVFLFFFLFFFQGRLSSLFKRNDQCTIRMQEFAIRPWVLVWKSYRLVFNRRAEVYSNHTVICLS